MSDGEKRTIVLLIIFLIGAFVLIYAHEKRINEMKKSIEILNKYLDIEVHDE